MSLVADGFRCEQCAGTIKEAYLAGDNGDNGCVERFYYMGDTLDGDGGADIAATSRIRTGWMKFWELFTFLTPRAPPIEMRGSSVCQ